MQIVVCCSYLFDDELIFFFFPFILKWNGQVCTYLFFEWWNFDFAKYLWKKPNIDKTRAEGEREFLNDQTYRKHQCSIKRSIMDSILWTWFICFDWIGLLETLTNLRLTPQKLTCNWHHTQTTNSSRLQVLANINWT